MSKYESKRVDRVEFSKRCCWLPREKLLVMVCYLSPLELRYICMLSFNVRGPQFVKVGKHAMYPSMRWSYLRCRLLLVRANVTVEALSEEDADRVGKAVIRSRLQLMNGPMSFSDGKAVK
jgi:hypothetical protein